jgi:divalent metal cation (Fe/Co/Zn/Cd) transporter
MAAELTAQLVTLGGNSGYDVRPDLLSGAATAYTRSAAFPGQFAQANRIAHRWMFTDAVQQSDESGRWEIDLSPMLADSSFQDTLRDFGIRAPSTLVVPLTENVSDSLRPGQLRQLARWGPWVSVGAMVLTGVLALFTVAVARSRGKALAALGVSALIVGAAGWAGIEVAQRYLGRALDQTTGDVRDIVQAMVDHAEGSLHQWLNLTLAAGGVLVVFGVIVSMLGGLRR